MTTTGRNVWYDLMTDDVDGAIGFYSEAIGWTAKAWDQADPEMPYTMWMMGEEGIGGIMKLPAEAKAMGAPPHWLAYTTVADVDETSKRVQSLGGTIHREPFDIPNVGRIAILADPQGATFAAYKPLNEMDTSGGDKPGRMGWAELNTTDYEGAWKFYSTLFGWEHSSSMDMGPAGTYFMFKDASDTTKGGMCNMAAQMNMPAHWLHYVSVDDMDAAIARIKRAGGKVLNGPMEIPGDDLIAQCQDPQGAAFAIYAEGKKD